MHLAQKAAFFSDLNVLLSRFFIKKDFMSQDHSRGQARKHLTLVGKYLSVLNCFRKEDKKKVVKNRIIDQKRTSGM